MKIWKKMSPGSRGQSTVSIKSCSIRLAPVRLA